MKAPMDEAKALVNALRTAWAKGFGVIMFFILGILCGILYAESRIIDDCRYAGSFRVHTQVFTCQRKL
jgi:hypothetical protein